MINIPHGKYDDRDLDRELRAIRDAIIDLYGGLPEPTSSTVVVSSGGGTSTSIGGSIGGTDVRHGIVSLSEGSNIVVFSSAMPASSFTLPRVRCYVTTDGIYEDVEGSISAKTVNGFTIYVIKACTCEYVALY